MITRTLNLRHVLGPVLGLAGFAVAFASTSSATAQDGAAPSAPAAGSAAAPAATPAPAAPAAGTPEDEEAKKKAAAAAAAGSAAPAAPAASSAAPAAAPPAAPAAAPAAAGPTITIGASSDPTKKDEPSKPADAKADDEKPNPWRGSIVVFDQSATTNSFSKSAQLSYLPVYEWWISPRAVYNLSPKARITLRQDLFKEWTNTEETTTRREWRYTDTWLSAGYGDKLEAISKKLRYGLSAQFRPGISKESRIAGQYFALAGGGSLSYTFDLAGEKAKAFRTLNVSTSVQYSHAFTKCTTTCNDDFEQTRMGTDQRTKTDNQVRAGSLVGNTLLYTANVGLDLVEHLDLSASMIWISSFAYQTSDASIGGNPIPKAADDTRLRQLSWFFAQASYGISPEVDLAFGYYNLNTVLHTDGKYRNPFWSPEARVFFDVYVHLDALYDRFVHGDEAKKGHKGAAGRVM